MTDSPESQVSETPEAPAVVTSILGSLREARAKLGTDADPLYLEVPGYDGQLIIRYKWIPFRDLTRTSQQLSKISEPTQQAVAAAADTVVLTCEEVYVNVDGQRLPLSTDGTPVTFGDPRLAYALGFETQASARDNAIRVFKNEYALLQQAAEVTEWLKDTTQKVDAAFVGE